MSDGGTFSPIHREVIEALPRLKPPALMVYTVLADAANKESGLCSLSIEELSNRTGLHRRRVLRALEKLEHDDFGFIERQNQYRPGGGRSNNQYKLPLVAGMSGKAKVTKRNLMPADQATISDKTEPNGWGIGDKRAPTIGDKREPSNKETRTNTRTKRRDLAAQDSHDLELAEWMEKLIRTVAPKGKLTTSKWPDHIRKMREIDKYSHGEIRELFEFAHGHKFWRKVIKSPAKLREKAVDLEFERASSNGHTNGHPARLHTGRDYGALAARNSIRVTST